MRLWHQELIPNLPRQQLLGQHRECAALRGKGWGKSHSVVNYVFDYSYMLLYNYHILIMDEMLRRGYNVCVEWIEHLYRGKILGYAKSLFDLPKYNVYPVSSNVIYPEHNDDYLQECIDNLRNKGIIL